MFYSDIKTFHLIYGLILYGYAAIFFVKPHPQKLKTIAVFPALSTISACKCVLARPCVHTLQEVALSTIQETLLCFPFAIGRVRNVYGATLHDRVLVCASIGCASIVAAIPGDLLCGHTDTTQWVCSHHTTQQNRPRVFFYGVQSAAC